jgi:hypothetical protein
VAYTRLMSVSRRLRLILSSLIFLGIGLGVGYFVALGDLLDWQAARDYVAVPAAIEYVELDEFYNSDHGSTYRVRAAYHYDYHGESYHSKRVAISESADNFDDHHHRLYSQLLQAQKAKQPVIAWVDPHNPSQALLDREMRWELFHSKASFFLIFTTIGLVIIIVAFRTAPQGDGAAMRVTKPARRATRQDGKITSGSRSEITVFWIFTSFWNAFTLFMLWVMLDSAHFLVIGLVGLIFLGAGLFLLYHAVWKTLQWRRFGALTLNIHPSPAVMGDTLQGNIELRERFPGNVQFLVTLSCIHSLTTGSGKHRRTTEDVIWRGGATPATSSYGIQGTRLDFRIAVPTGLPASQKRSNDYHYWAINIKAEIPGVNLDHDFRIPVIAGSNH